MADQMLRLDQALGSFIANAEQVVGKANILTALSADHAVMPLPEYIVSVQHQSARRISPRNEINPAVDSLDRQLQRAFNTSEHVFRSNGFLNYAVASAAGVDSLELERRVREGATKVPGISDIYFRREILDTATPDRPHLQNYRHGYYPPRGEDFIVRFCENCLVTSSAAGTSHGSPYSYDTHVPVVFWGAGVKAGSVQRPVHSVDIAPTLITLVGFRYPDSIDGVPLKEIVH
jgi:hypothetical protein